MNTIHTRKPDYNFKEMTDEQVCGHSSRRAK